MQVDPIKPTLKAPGTERLRLECDEPLSNFAFKFNLRRYRLEQVRQLLSSGGARKQVASTKVGQCRLTLSNRR